MQIFLVSRMRIFGSHRCTSRGNNRSKRWVKPIKSHKKSKQQQQRNKNDTNKQTVYPQYKKQCTNKAKRVLNFSETYVALIKLPVSRSAKFLDSAFLWTQNHGVYVAPQWCQCHLSNWITTALIFNEHPMPVDAVMHRKDIRGIETFFNSIGDVVSQVILRQYFINW